jgi:hypothetical protein
MKDLLLTIWRDPRLFSFIIMTMYGASAIRFGFGGYWADMCYWLSALAITATVTFGYNR